MSIPWWVKIVQLSGIYIDSGASSHMSPFKLNDNIDEETKNIVTANNQKMNVYGSGNTSINVNNEDIDIKNVLYVPNLSVNLLSVSKIVDNGNSVLFNYDGCTLYNQKQ